MQTMQNNKMFKMMTYFKHERDLKKVFVTHQIESFIVENDLTRKLLHAIIELLNISIRHRKF